MMPRNVSDAYVYCTGTIPALYEKWCGAHKIEQVPTTQVRVAENNQAEMFG